MAAEGCRRMRKMTILIKCFRLSRKTWLHSDYFKRSGFYSIAAALCGLLTSGIMFFLCHKVIFGILFLVIAILNIILNWFIWFVTTLREHYRDER